MKSVVFAILILNVLSCTSILESASNCDLQEGTARCDSLEGACNGQFSKWRKDGETKCSCCDEPEELRNPHSDIDFYNHKD
jgi:hypothetical protein